MHFMLATNIEMFELLPSKLLVDEIQVLLIWSFIIIQDMNNVFTEFSDNKV